MIAIAGACCLGVIALRPGEPVNAIWIVTAAIAVFLIAHRVYARFIADKVLQLDPSPLVGPVLAAQMGYLPGTLWIVVGVVFAGAVQDFMILGLSLRHGGRSLGQMLREELGEVPGIVAMVGVLAPAKTTAEMERIITNNRVDMALTALFMLLVITMVLVSLRAILRGWRTDQATAREEPYVALATVAVPGARP